MASKRKCVARATIRSIPSREYGALALAAARSRQPARHRQRPDYSLTLYNDGKVYWHTRIVAGKPNLATPMVSAEMKFITVNPTWNVPPSIIEKEYLPALEQDPQALERIGLKLTQDADGTIHISQPPGAGNALGRIRFNFPNKFLVYQHDTPDKYLFAREKRAYSHGCMRVQNPLTYGEKLLSLVLPKSATPKRSLKACSAAARSTSTSRNSSRCI
jgi:murein L,D-transpeptidase YcbB/YkuD